MLDPMQSLWVGTRLSTMERLSIKSYLAHGHSYHLYTYGPLEGVPEGVVLKDGNEIVPASRIAEFKHIANFSDLFRYSLLHKHGGYWTDTDAVCLKPFDFPEEFVFSSEAKQREDGHIQVNSGTIKVPAGSKLMQYALDRFNKIDVKNAGWIQLGPQLMAEIVKVHKLERYVKAPKIFCPVPWWDANLLTKTTFGLPYSYAVHLWNEMWSKFKLDKDAQYPPGSLYEELKRKYLA